MKLCVNGSQTKARTPAWVPLKFVPLARDNVTGMFSLPIGVRAACDLCVARIEDRLSCGQYVSCNHCYAKTRIDRTPGYWVSDVGTAETPVPEENLPALEENQEPLETDDGYDDDDDDDDIIW